MTRAFSRPLCALILTSAILSWFLIPRPICADTPAPIAESKLLEPKPILEGDKVVTLYPPGHPALKNLAGFDKPENFNMSKGANPHVLNITNIHNPSIELQLPPADKANGTAVIVAAGGGNTTLWVGPEGADIGKWLNGLGVAAFNLRYRLKPYDSAVDALADTQRAIRTVRAHAKEWGVDPKKIGIMGFSAGGEQAARAALNFDEGKPDATDPIDRESSRPDFAVLVYAGWRQVDLSNVPKNAPPAFCVCRRPGRRLPCQRDGRFLQRVFQRQDSGRAAHLRPRRTRRRHRPPQRHPLRRVAEPVRRVGDRYRDVAEGRGDDRVKVKCSCRSTACGVPSHMRRARLRRSASPPSAAQPIESKMTLEGSGTAPAAPPSSELPLLLELAEDADDVAAAVRPGVLTSVTSDSSATKLVSSAVPSLVFAPLTAWLICLITAGTTTAAMLIPDEA